MNAENFVESIKISVIESAIRTMNQYFTEPPGRKPDTFLKDISVWFNGMSESDKEMVQKIVTQAVQTSVFGFLCVLDGVRAIENTADKGQLLLYFEKHGQRTLLNDPDTEYLHDLL